MRFLIPSVCIVNVLAAQQPAPPTTSVNAIAVARRPIRVWTSRAIATVLAEIGPDFEQTTGYKLTITSDLPPAFVRRANAGESFDLLISMSSTVDDWIKDGRVVAGTRTNIARSGIGVEVRTGAPKPDISSVEAFKRALLNAKSIAYLRVGSGIYLAGLLERLGIADAVNAKSTRPETDIVSELVAKGEVELGVVVLTQILTTPGVDLVGPLPAEIQSYLTFTGGVSASSRDPDAAKQLLEFLAGPAAARVMRAQGMDPAAPIPVPPPGPDPWVEAERKIIRLAPSAFPSLPRAVRAELERRRCTIPQTIEIAGPHNVISGHFKNTKQVDWAVLCSRGGSSTVLVFWRGGVARVDSLGSSRDAGFLQTLGPQGIGFSRIISVASREFILDHAREYDGPIPAEPIHDGINDAFAGKASGIAYFTGKKWIGLAGAD